MRKTFIGPRLRQLRLQHKQTQAEMAKAISVSPAYVTMLENNQRSLSVQVLIAIEEAYDVNWRNLVDGDQTTTLADLKTALQDPLFAGTSPDIQELRGAIDHAPTLVENLLHLYKSHRTTLERLMRSGATQDSGALVESSPETIIHDFFRNHKNHFAELETAAERLRREEACEADEVQSVLKRRLKTKHDVAVRLRSVDEMSGALRIFDREASELLLSEALDHQNRTFQLAHMLGLLELVGILDRLIADSGIASQVGIARCQIELANYFAAAFLMPYEEYLAAAERTRYDIDRLAAGFGVSFEQACHRLTTLSRKGSEGVPFFFIRIDKAGNVTKRFNSTTFQLAEYGGACPVWNIHTTFQTPGLITPQFVELPDGDRFFTISRTTDRPSFSQDTQDRRLSLALGCKIEHAARIGYTQQFNFEDDNMFSPIGISCSLCPRAACSQRAHQPAIVDLQIDTDRRGDTRYES
jgi:predicted transcriptional regulator/DNA-binding XRE family transcriptional regulator